MPEQYDFILAWPDDMSSLTISAQNERAQLYLANHFENYFGGMVVTTWPKALPVLMKMTKQGWRIG